MSYQNSKSFGFHGTNTRLRIASIHVARCTAIQWLNQLHNICPPTVDRIHPQCGLRELKKEEKKAHAIKKAMI